MRIRFSEILHWYKKGITSGFFLCYEVTMWMVEFHLISGLNVVIEYDNGEERVIRTEKDFKRLVKDIHREAIKDPEIREILEKAASEID